MANAIAETPANSSLQRFGQFGCALQSQGDPQRIIDFLVENAVEAAGACGGFLRFTAPHSGEVAWRAVNGRGRLVPLPTLIRWEEAVARDRRASILPLDAPQPADICQVVGVPLTLGEDLLGCLLVLFDTPRSLSDHEMEFLTCLAALGACAADNARRAARQRSRYDQLALHTEKLSALGRMSAGIAHEINNPLAGILLFSSNLVKKVPAGSQLRDGLQVIIDETVRCRGIIQELLEFSRERPLRRVPCQVNEVLEKAVAIVENELHLHHAQLQVDLAADLPPIPLDPAQIEQVFVNLLLNALEALDGPGTVGVRSAREPGRAGAVRVEVSDTGRGIPESHLDTIFEPFFSTKEKGTGLGLAVSYGIVRNHGGELHAENRPEGGCRFTVRLPAAPGSDPGRG